jgi:hypothetical protein
MAHDGACVPVEIRRRLSAFHDAQEKYQRALLQARNAAVASESEEKLKRIHTRKWGLFFRWE